MDSLNAALAASFDVDPRRLSLMATDLEIDLFDGPSNTAGVVAATTFGDGSVSPCVPPAVRS